jgi:hypothetical protein
MLSGSLKADLNIFYYLARPKIPDEGNAPAKRNKDEWHQYRHEAEHAKR